MSLDLEIPLGPARSPCGSKCRRTIFKRMSALRDMKDVPMTSYDSRPGRDALTPL